MVKSAEETPPTRNVSAQMFITIAGRFSLERPAATTGLKPQMHLHSHPIETRHLLGRCFAEIDLMINLPGARESNGTTASFCAADMSALTSGSARTAAPSR